MTLGDGEQSERTDAVAEESLDDVVGKSSTLEEAANERKRRLKQMREQMKQGEGEEEESGPSNKEARPSFRSYEPQSDIGDKRNDADLFAVEKEIADQLADTEDTAVIEQVDITTLAPRKIDWDLKRDVAERLEKLERRTERAIAQLIRERLKAGKTELADAVSSGAYSELQTDE